ncbi:hypothetical protein [Streptomyces sp. NPDC003480]
MSVRCLDGISTRLVPRDARGGRVRRQHHGDDLAAHRFRFEHEPVREPVVTADHHVLRALSKVRRRTGS